MRKFEITEIQYDSDEALDDIGLPTTLIFESDLSDMDDIEEAANEYISDTTGFCHKGFKLEETES